MPGYETTNSCEVIDLKSPTSTCKSIPNLPMKVADAIGGLGFQENPVICGGWQNKTFDKNCFSLENNNWVSTDSMNAVRGFSAATQLQDGRLLVTGGLDDYSHFINSAELLTENGWKSKVASLPFTIGAHCMVTINSTTVMVIGGTQNGQNSANTFYLNIERQSWTEGPALKTTRYAHSCGRIRKDQNSQELSIIVAGGTNDDSPLLSSVEVLDEGSKEWQTGPELPFGIKYAKIVEDPSRGVVLIGGYYSAHQYLDTLFQLAHGGKDAEWTEMEQKLKIEKSYHTAFLVPDSIVDCCT